MEECAICKGKRLKVMYDFSLERKIGDISNLKILKCCDCGLVYSSLLSRPDLLRNIYGQEYFETEPLLGFEQFSFTKEGIVLLDNVKSNFFRKSLDKIKLYKKEGRLLDVGCGNGLFMYLARMHGYDTVGVDVSDYSTRWVREKLGLNTITGQLEEALFPDNHFDIITLWDVVEHLVDLHSFFSECSRVLKQDGLIVIRTPGRDSLFHLAARLLYLLSGGRFLYPIKKVFHLSHTYYLSLKNIEWLFKKYNFRIMDLKREDRIHKEVEKESIIPRSLIRLLHYMAILLKRQHEMLIFARKEEGDRADRDTVSKIPKGI